MINKLSFLQKLLGKRKERLPHDMSNEMAKKLTIEDFGSEEEVKKIAQMLRNVKTRGEAEAILKDLMQKGALTNKNNPDLKPVITKKTMGKILGGNWQVAGNIDQLFENAIEPWKFELDPNKKNQDVGHHSQSQLEAAPLPARHPDSTGNNPDTNNIPNTDTIVNRINDRISRIGHPTGRH